MTPAERKLAYLEVLLDELGVDPAELEGATPAEWLVELERVLSERGITIAETERWATQCEPEAPPDDAALECFRRRARIAVAEPVPSPVIWLGAGLVGLGVTYGVARWLRR